MLRGFRRGVLVIAAGLLVLAPLLTTFTPAVANAASANPLDQLERWMYYRGMRACLEAPYFEQGTGDDNETISISDINAGHLWIQNRSGTIGDTGVYADQKEGFGYLASSLDDLDGDDGTVQCTDGSIWVRGAHVFGFENVINLVCAMNAAIGELGQDSRIDPQRDGGKCENAEEVFFDGDDSDIFQRALTRALESDIATQYGGDGDRPLITLSDNGHADYNWRALYYLLGKNSLETFCGGSLSSAKPNDNYKDDKYDVSVYIVEDGKIKKSGVGEEGFSHSYTVSNSDRDENSKVNDVYYKSGGNVNEADDVSCADMAKLTRENARAYAEWAVNNKETAEDNETGTQTEDESGAGGEVKTTCAIDGIGWIVCPVMNFMANIIDKAYAQVASWLTITPVSTTGGGSAMYSAWVKMRDIANIAFVIAFMIIVYSQLTSAGVSNYGIKKLLPKIVIAAIMVNLSYIICTIAVDVSNIAGKSLYSLFETNSFSKGIDTSHFKGEAWATGEGNDLIGWGGIVAAILGSAAIIYLALPALIIALPTALLAIVTVFLVLALRQVLIILLIVISPLAFIALLLPNTEDWFRRWRKLFVALLVMYPVISLLFGASALASTIVMNSATDVEGDGKISLQLMGALITVLPLVLTPVIMKASSGVMNRFAGIVNNPNRGPFDAMRKRAEATAGRIRNNRDIRATNRGAFSLRKRGLEGAAKRDAIQRRRDSAVKSLAYQGSVQGYTKRANDQEKITQKMENDFEVRDIQGKLDHAGLHADVRTNLLNSQFSRKLAETDESSRAEEAHIMNNRNAYNQMYQSTEDLEAARIESKNDFYGNTAAGKVSSQRLQVAKGIKQNIQTERELDFMESDDGVDIALRRDDLGQQKTIKTAQTEQLAIGQNQTVRVAAQAATDSLDATKADETAFIQELRTEEGAKIRNVDQMSAEMQASVQQLQSADTAKRVQAQRTTNAQDVAVQAFAKAVGTNPAAPTNLATLAGGIAGASGTLQAQAVAKQTMLKGANEAIAAGKTLYSQTENKPLLDRMDEPDFLDLPDEQISAIAGVVAGREHQESHVKLWSKMGGLAQQAEQERAAAEAAEQAKESEV